jgi:Asparagine synthase
MKKRTGIIPYQTTLYETSTGRIIPRSDWTTYPGTLDLEEICVFAACGFFLGNASYYKELKAIPPASEYDDNDGIVSNIKPYFKWNYQPREISLQQATNEFTEIFNRVVQQGVAGKKVILPLSGGLDSRSLAAALKAHSPLYSYSYGYKNGVPETQYSKQIADAENFPFQGFEIGDNYLWKKIDFLSDILQNYSEFTHPRQMAVYDELKGKGDLFVLGHWGDVLFDGMGMKDDASFEEMVDALFKKKGGKELGEDLWNHWNLPGSFSVYLRDRLSSLLAEIEINNPNARIRAFKSLHWASRWTNSSLYIFHTISPIFVPYFEDELCQFITTVPEKWLNARQIQIEYLKENAPELAQIHWQKYPGRNLFNYPSFHAWWFKPVRLAKKMQRKFSKTPLIQRNWELQFLGEENKKFLHERIYHPTFNQWIPQKLVEPFFEKFTQNGVKFSHPLSILLTLSSFWKKKNA